MELGNERRLSFQRNFLIAIVKYLIERKQPAFDVIVQKIRQEGEEFHRMVLGGKTNMAAWASSFSEVRISG